VFPIRLILCPFLLLAALTCQAQVFWSVTDADGGQNWLLGTVHSEDPRLLDFPPELMEALRQSDRVALELVPDGSMLARLTEAMHYEDGRLHKVLGPELYPRVVELLEQDYGMGEPAVRRMRPWAVAMTLSLPPPQTGLFMDLALSFRASAMGKDVIALETLDEQLGFFEGMGEAGQIELVRQAVADHGQIPELFEELISVYLSGELDELEALSRAQIDQLGPEVAHHFQQVGLVDRNHVMVERAMPHLREGGLIIAVGALHLPGEDGLIDLLRAQGFTVEGIY
jgi:uncharacterized protein YbaP (TraB family)